MNTHPIRATGILFVAMLLATTLCSPSSAQSPTAIGGLIITLNELQGTINKAMTTADVVSANKLEAADARIRALLPQLERVKNGAVKDANDLTSELVREANLIVHDLRRTVRETESSAFTQLNQTLAVTSQILDNMPLVDVDPYISAIEPTRVFASPADRRLTIYGHLPGDPKKDISVRIGDTLVPAVRTKSSGLAVEIPRNIKLVESSYLPVAVSVTTHSGIFNLFSNETKIADRIYVSKAAPFQCEARWMLANPDYLVEVPAVNGFSDEATTQSNAARTTINRTIAARDLFIATVPGAADKYDLDTVRIKDPHARFRDYGDCEHYRTRHQITVWNPETVSYELYAPEVQHHLHKGWKIQRVLFGKTKLPYSYYVSAGGTKSAIDMSPVFLATRKGVQPRKLVASQTFKAGWQVFDVDARTTETKDWSIHVSCSFEDGREKWSSGELVLNPLDNEAAGRGVMARVADGRLYIQTLLDGEQPLQEKEASLVGTSNSSKIIAAK